MAEIDYGAARRELEALFASVEEALDRGCNIRLESAIQKDVDALFKSSTQAFREVLTGCLLARLQYKKIDVHLPYVNQGNRAFNGRTLDERAVNPFLHDKHIPSSRGPYLGVFRRSVRFRRATATGIRDKTGFAALLRVLDCLQGIKDNNSIRQLLIYVLWKFAELREAASIPVSRLKRISLDQCEALISSLLSRPSGGRFPVVLVLSAFTTIKEHYGLQWQISSQEINVADASSGAGGDVTISERGQVLLAAEITERPVDRSKVVATFNTKIAPTGIDDYLFLLKDAAVSDDVREQARQYFAQGHDVNFLAIKEWILMTLATLGRKGRERFLSELARRIDEEKMPRTVKVHWNEAIAQLTTSRTQKPREP
jgi:hypothetical protein